MENIDVTGKDKHRVILEFLLQIKREVGGVG